MNCRQPNKETPTTVFAPGECKQIDLSQCKVPPKIETVMSEILPNRSSQAPDEKHWTDVKASSTAPNFRGIAGTRCTTAPGVPIRLRVEEKAGRDCYSVSKIT